MKSDPDKPPAPAAPSWTSCLGRARHDLRNPLSEILGFSEILQEEAAERGLKQMIPGFAAIHQSAARIFAEVNHWLNPDTIRMTPESFRELEQTIQSLSQRIISTAESLSEKCDELENNWVGDDLLRIGGAARKLRDSAPPLLHELADSFAAKGRSEEDDTTVSVPSGTSSETTFVRELEGEPGTVSGSVLIVDDAETNRALLARRLRRQGYTVSLAENGRQALEKLRARRFDLVLLDVIMPEMGGYHVLEIMNPPVVLRQRRTSSGDSRRRSGPG